ncbi:hypothetical protein L226DRAFT_472741 [Lentinus tigrinus ALCF2SS1-7]|uniref:Uncharacterized protein n=1 Tax=Lentinus tigrinus ALCF2SS1-6 TaxID=1328759 RepID=A0A5C2RRT3_9APHY|nr:hypothetical protein L227DRAFT_616665 [Lentinus tigrinus ALCF2SS1-6]RPD68811.1 hypothetical protein L226DRAFT_472741 [Lentinus tigrinus ALCF2SS1-7]
MSSGDLHADAGTRTGSGSELGSQKDSPTFPSPFEFHVRDPITLVELRMRKLSGMVRQKPRWWEKVHDNALVAKWRAEMVEYDRVARENAWEIETDWGSDEDEEDEGEDEDDEDDKEDQDNEDDEEDKDKDDKDDEEYDRYGPKSRRNALTDAQLDYIFAELKYVAGQRDERTGIYATTIPGVYQSASLVPAELKRALVEGVALLEDVPEDEKDWHPGSKRQVLDLLHPSLYCLRPGTTLILKADSEAGRVPGSDPLTSYPLADYLKDRDDFSDVENLGRTISRDFQWLPTVFDVSETGEVARKSYINNLHPIKHASLYTAITSILERFVPMFEKVLSDAASPSPKRVIDVDVLGWYSHLGPEPDYDDDDYQEWKSRRWPLIPDPPTFAPPTEEGRINVSLKGCSIRVIIKLANIILTPEKPTYPGGSWHIEGMENERIVATGIYYYASENITESRLAFRMQIGTDPECIDMEYQHDDNKGWRTAFGLSNEDSLNQELGHILAEEDTCVAFPNIHQHRVEPFELADRTRPGHRKILAFFLTDPYHAVQSTTMVPPQQREWYLDEMERIAALRRLPKELFDMIAEYALEGTITRAEAQADRERLMKERKNFVVQHNEDVFELGFSLCEH